MFVFSVKARYIRMFFAALILGVAVFAVVRLFPDVPASLPVNGTASAADALPDGLKDAEGVYAMLVNLGYTLEPQPLETVQVKVPRRFDTLYETYNAVQLEGGFNLAKYGGRTVTRYSFRVTDVPESMNKPLGTATVSVLVYKGKVIGGDLYDEGGEGNVVCFLMA